MKLFKFAALMATTLAAVSCSNDINNDVTAPVSDPATSGYISLSVAMDRAAEKRAVSYDAGTAEENAVINGRLLLFRNAAKEADATLVCISDLSGMNWSEPKAGEVSSTSGAVAELTDIDLNDDAAQYSALVVLNYNKDFKFPAKGDKFGTWSQTAQSSATVTADGKTYLTMSSAPCLKASGTAPATLVPVNKQAVAQSPAKISSNAATVYVQRAVAKVTVETGKFDLRGQSYAGDKIEFKAWALDITNRSMYPVQVTEPLAGSYSSIWSKARFSAAENAAFRRVFWSYDPNYNKDITTAEAIAAAFNVVATDKVTENAGYAYCMENTFDVNHQMQGQTTRVVLKGAYTPSSIANYTAGTTFYRVGTSTKMMLKNDFANDIKAKAQAIKGSGTYTIDLKGVTNTAGYHSFSEISILKDGSEIDDATRNAVAKAYGLKDASEKGIATYRNGECYYAVRIMHFGNDETPWKIGDETYGGNNDKYLGRYGVVRNTLYEVKINSVSAPGAPAVPAIDPTEPDDVSSYYIDVDIRLLPWVKRVNNQDL